MNYHDTFKSLELYLLHKADFEGLRILTDCIQNEINGNAKKQKIEEEKMKEEFMKERRESLKELEKESERLKQLDKELEEYLKGTEEENWELTEEEKISIMNDAEEDMNHWYSESVVSENNSSWEYNLDYDNYILIETTYDGYIGKSEYTQKAAN